MRRREFITLLGGMAAAWPRVARAQQGALPVVGILMGGSPETYVGVIPAMNQGLKEAGYTEGQNVEIAIRFAQGQYDQLPALAAELVRRQVAVILAGSLPSVFAAKAATSTIPIVFTSAGDSVKIGLVRSLNRPDGNITGFTNIGVDLAPKRLELLLQLVPTATVIGLLVNPTNPRVDLEIAEIQVAARTVGKQILLVKAGSEHEIDAAFAALVQGSAGGLIVTAEPLFVQQQKQLVALASTHALPAIYEYREFTAAGGLVSYGPSPPELYRQAAGYVGRILKGAKIAELPVQRSTRVELVINLKTAKALGLEVPMSLLMRVDEVIE
jgi:putative tryptophan/tyrosine transport system substrate-binding protein